HDLARGELGVHRVHLHEVLLLLKLKHLESPDKRLHRILVQAAREPLERRRLRDPRSVAVYEEQPRWHPVSKPPLGVELAHQSARYRLWLHRAMSATSEIALRAAAN